MHGYAVRHKVSGADDSTYEEDTVYPRPGEASGTVTITDLNRGTA